MRSQPGRNYTSDDRVMTPVPLAQAIVAALKPSGSILEPCAGAGSFVDALADCGVVRQCEIDHGSDFLHWRDHVDWVVTNPPWSKFRPVLVHALTIADHVALLATVNHWWTRRRVEEVAKAGFGYKHLLLIRPWPVEFPSSGFQLGMMHVERGYIGPLTISDLKWRDELTLLREPDYVVDQQTGASNVDG